MNPILWIIVGIVAESSTVIGSRLIEGMFLVDISKKATDKGYKVSKEYIDELTKRIGDEDIKAKRNNKLNLRSIFKKICLFLPVINLISAKVRTSKKVDNWLQEAIENEKVIPMTEEEKNNYNSLEKKFEKVVVATSYGKKEKNYDSIQEDIEKIKEIVNEINPSCTMRLEYELMPLNYTLDEVKKLNEQFDGSTYMIGEKAGGQNVAVIGIPRTKNISHVDRITFKTNFKQKYKITYEYRKLSSEEAKDKTFYVYSYEDLKCYPQVEKIIQEIKQSRIDDGIKINSVPLEVHNIFKEEVSQTKPEEVLHEKQASQLVKTINTKKR